MAQRTLDREDWIDAGLTALEAGGTEAVAALPLARALGVTRGSFYWHFASREELLEAVVARWERDHSDAVLDALESITDPWERLRALCERAASKPPSLFIRLLEATDREPAAREAIQRSSERRLAVIGRACRETGMTPAVARRHALLMYSAYVGLARLLDEEPGRMTPRERAAYARHLVVTLVPSE